MTASDHRGRSVDAGRRSLQNKWGVAHHPEVGDWNYIGPHGRVTPRNPTPMYTGKYFKTAHSTSDGISMRADLTPFPVQSSYSKVNSRYFYSGHIDPHSLDSSTRTFLNKTGIDSKDTFRKGWKYSSDNFIEPTGRGEFTWSVGPDTSFTKKQLSKSPVVQTFQPGTKYSNKGKQGYGGAVSTPYRALVAAEAMRNRVLQGRDIQTGRGSKNTKTVSSLEFS